MKIGIDLLVCAAATAIAAISANQVKAQPADATPAQAPGAETPGDIIVTAQKRSERVQDVPIAITAQSGATLTNRGVSSMKDLQVTVPGLQFNQAAGDPQTFLRGVGSDAVQVNSDPSVVPYFDGVFAGFAKGLDFDLLAYERVEVLAGPQGTLYGRNAVGGAINFITRTPTQTLDGSAALTVGNYGLVEGTGYVEGGIAPHLSVGLYGTVSTRDSYTHFNLTTPQAATLTPSHVRRYHVRGKAVYDNGPLKLTATFEYEHIRTPEDAAFRQVDPEALGYLFGASEGPQAPYHVTTDSGDSSTTSLYAGTLREEYDLGWASILGISGYRRTTNTSYVDFDGTSSALFIFSAHPEKARDISQEIQLISHANGPFKWIVGLYYYNQIGGFEPEGLILPNPLISPVAVEDIYSFARTQSYSAFAQETYSLTDAVHLTVGGRFTHDAKQFNAWTEYQNLDGTTAIPTTYFPNSTHTWNNFTPKVTLDAKINNTTLVYATFSQGYKSGAYNLTNPEDPGPVNPEKLTSYEAGTKFSLLDRHLNLNLAAYYYRFKDQQVTVINGNTGETSLQNAASSKIYGLDASFDARVTQGFRLNGAVAYNNAKYGTFLGLPDPVTNAPTDVSGHREERAPVWTVTSGGSYRYDLSNGAAIEASANWYHNSGFYWDPTNADRQGAYDVVNANLGLYLRNDTIKATVWAKNLLNKYYEVQSIRSAIGHDVVDSPPRTVGVTLAFTG